MTVRIDIFEGETKTDTEDDWESSPCEFVPETDGVILPEREFETEGDGVSLSKQGDREGDKLAVLEREGDEDALSDEVLERDSEGETLGESEVLSVWELVTEIDAVIETDCVWLSVLELEAVVVAVLLELELPESVVEGV